MPAILILYGTTDGHTRKVANSVADTVRTAGCTADVVEAASAGGRIGPEGYDGVVVAASVHAGKFQGPVRRWVEMHAPVLNQMPSAFIAVCLAVLDQRPAGREAVEASIQRFFTQTHWLRPLHTAVAGALLYTRYNWIKRWIMKRIVAKAGGDTDTSRDYEYTDWAALRTFTRHFAALVQERSRTLQEDFASTLTAS